MAQGKFKKKTNPVPTKKQKKNTAAFTRRSNAPIQQKKSKFTENKKLKEVISKTVNKNFETELRSRATEGQLTLSKAQQAVAKHHSNQAPK